MRKLTTLLLWATAGCLAACGDTVESPEQELRAWVERGELAAEDRDRGTLLDMIGAGYRDGRGNDRDSIGDMLRLYFFRQQSIALLVDIEDIVVTGGTAAVVDLTVGMAGTKNGMPGFSADAYRFEFELEKPEDEWILIGARWGAIGHDVH